MCGRATHHYTWRQIHDHLASFAAKVAPLKALDGPAPNYNLPPKGRAPVLRMTPDGLAGDLLLWWLLPHWAKSPEMKYPTFNARSEDAANKPSFRSPFRKRRCAIPVSGFYEWQKLDDGDKQPHHIARADGAPLYLAGLWDRWDKGDEPIESCAILTTSPNAEMATLHHRMPCILEPEDLEPYLDPDRTDPDDIQPFLHPAPDGILHTPPVDKAVGNIRNNTPNLTTPI